MIDDTIPWNRKYWDLTDQLYWSPEYVGLRSVGESEFIVHDNMISVPRELVRRGSRLYRRVRDVTDHTRWMVGQEEILNHVFNIAFGIAPDALIERCFLAPLAFSDSGPFSSFGREVGDRYGWGRLENVTQQDGFFVSQKSLVGVELKIRATTRPEQIAKYVALIAWEEALTRPRNQVGLIFIVPDAADHNHLKSCRLASTAIDRSYLDVLARHRPKGRVGRLFEDSPETVAGILDRLQLTFLSWRDLLTTIAGFCEGLDPAVPGDQTLLRLVAGLRAQIESQVFMGQSEPSASGRTKA